MTLIIQKERESDSLLQECVLWVYVFNKTLAEQRLKLEEKLSGMVTIIPQMCEIVVPISEFRQIATILPPCHLYLKLCIGTGMKHSFSELMKRQ